ncbi:MAG: BON domain-containing protein [Planctomycetaceae bacterium]|jgi:Flp pilus assembly secretin CpaC|nr:BON domain-containing protein [Planctomycetaceae bacterium]MBT6483191.1 BON domain-containing protein [Planctomycetaceae bacterium]MBT6494765.1 BON domain-containing protein [Planctomycetaceae bacterium]
MRRHLLTALLMVTIACGLAAAADPPATAVAPDFAKSLTLPPTALIEAIKAMPAPRKTAPFDRAKDFTTIVAQTSKQPVPDTTAASPGPLAQVPTSKPKPSRRSTVAISTSQIATPPTTTHRAVKVKQGTVVKPADPGYTQIGSLFKVKLDRPKTELRLHENSTYTIATKRDDVEMIGNRNQRLIKIEKSERNGISFHTLKPGVTTLTFLDEAEKQYHVEMAIFGDRRQLQSQLDRLYPRASIQVINERVGVLLRGTVEEDKDLAAITKIAVQFYPKVNNQLKVAAAPVSAAKDSKPKPSRPATDPIPTNQITTPPTRSYKSVPATSYKVVKFKKAGSAKDPKSVDPGYTQTGSLFILKLDRPKTQLSLYENSTYSIFTKREDVGMIGTLNHRLVKMEEVESNGISFHTLEPGVTTLTFIDETEKQYLIEITIMGDTRQLQSQLVKLYPQASIQAIKVRESVLLRGTAAKPENIKEIVEIAEQFYPNVLNQLKVAGAPVAASGYRPPHGTPVYQPMKTPDYGKPQPNPTRRLTYPWPPVDLRPVYPGIPEPHTPYGAPQPRPTRAPAPRAKTPKPPITVQAVVLEIDWKKLAETKLDLTSTLRAFATDPKIRDLRGLSGPPQELRLLHTVAVPRNATDGIVRLLTATKAFNVISRPTIRTLLGQKAEVHIGTEIPIPVSQEVRNGKQQVEIEFLRLGTRIELTPETVTKGGIKLSVAAGHSERVGNSGIRTASGFTVPNIQTLKFSTVVELKEGESMILSHTGQAEGKKTAAGKGLMVILSPPKAIYSPSTTKPASTAWTPQKTAVPGVVRMIPQPVRPATFVPSAPVPQPQDLHQSVRELRNDVKALRQDVSRLLKVLEKKDKAWKELRQSKVSPAEQKIQTALEKQVSLQFEKIPLADAIRVLSQNANLNIVLDQRGMEEEGVTGKTPVTIHADGLMLKSGLNLMLQHLNLAYQVRDEVLVITSRQRANGPMIVVTYPVADLVIPIPTAGPVPEYELAPKDGKDALSARSPAIDFDALTETILSTVQPDSWDKVGGPASMQPFETTLSLVIRQTPEAHKEIAGLIAQLRRLQDLQVALESRFIEKLPEGIWKRIGVNIDSPRDAAKKDSNGKERRDIPLGGIILTDHQTELLLQTAQGDLRANLTQGPKVTLFNAQTAGIAKYAAGGKEQPLRHSLHVQPVISADRRNVRLNLRVSDLKSPWANTRAYVGTVPDGKTLLIEIAQGNGNEVGVPELEKIPYISRLFKNTGVRRSEGPQFLLIRPRVVVPEEEEELLPEPPVPNKVPGYRQSSKNTGAQKPVSYRTRTGTVTGRVIIQEEEEELLGIEK